MEKTLTIGQVGDIMSLIYGEKYEDLDKLRAQLPEILDFDEELVATLDEHLVSIANAHHLTESVPAHPSYTEQMMMAFGPNYREII